MKHKLLLLAFVLLLAVTAQAQTYDSLVFNAGTFQNDIRNMLVMRDGGILANMQLFEDDPVTHLGKDKGSLFIKSMRDSTGMYFSDSLFIEDNDMNYFLLERNPLDDDNVFAKIERNTDNCRSELRIRFFDDNLNFKTHKEAIVTVADTLITVLSDGYMLEPNGDIIAFFTIHPRNESHIIRAGLDGTLKGHVVVSSSEVPVKTEPQLGVFSESPREYYVYGCTNYYGDGLSIVVLDSLLNPIRTVIPGGLPLNYAFEHGNMTDKLMVWDDSTFWLCGHYKYTNVIDTIVPGGPAIDPAGNKNGLLLGKFRKSNASAISVRLISEVQFPYDDATYPIDIIKSDDGCAYFSYYGNHDNNTYSPELITMKLNKDLGKLWDMRCFNGNNNDSGCVGLEMRPLENGGVAIVGNGVYEYNHPDEAYMFFLVVDDLSFSLPENKAEERPYTFYPNPANEELNLNISPEVEPSLIELYDIQGRMVRSQQSGFETISLRGIPAGTYALRVSMKDGKQYTSAVVKK